MLLFPACCRILLYLGVGVGCLSWSEAWGASDLKMDLDTSSAQIAHKSCSTHAVFMLLNTRHKSRLGYWTGTLFFFFLSLQLADLQALSFIHPWACSALSLCHWIHGCCDPRRNAFGWESAAVPAALGAPPLGFLSAKAPWREQCLKLNCEQRLGSTWPVKPQWETKCHRVTDICAAPSTGTPRPAELELCKVCENPPFSTVFPTVCFRMARSYSSCEWLIIYRISSPCPQLGPFLKNRVKF